jgi:DNA-binding response OmpR family regulator
LLPVVFVSRRDAPGDVVAAFEAGADNYVVKPIEPLELRARLGAVLRRSWSLPYSPR